MLYATSKSSIFNFVVLFLVELTKQKQMQGSWISFTYMRYNIPHNVIMLVGLLTVFPFVIFWFR